jgi:hypothetical protein
MQTAPGWRRTSQSLGSEGFTIDDSRRSYMSRKRKGAASAQHIAAFRTGSGFLGSEQYNGVSLIAGVRRVAHYKMLRTNPSRDSLSRQYL